MRRSSFAFFLITLALLGRLVAPLAVEARGFDPLMDAPICTHDGGTPAPPDGDRSGTHAGQCAHMCCHIAAAVFVPPIEALVVLRASLPVHWSAAVSTNGAVSKPASLRARGPPLS